MFLKWSMIWNMSKGRLPELSSMHEESETVELGLVLFLAS